VVVELKFLCGQVTTRVLCQSFPKVVFAPLELNWDFEIAMKLY